MSGLPGPAERHHAAVLLAELTRSDSAAVVAQLPSRPGAAVPADVARRGAALSARDFWTAVARLEALGVLGRSDDGLSLDRDRLQAIAASWVADSPLHAVTADHPRLRAFIRWGRVVRMPTDPALIEELYEALGSVFQPGEQLDEPAVNARISAVHDDPADVRRALVDRGLLERRPGEAIYRRP